MPRTRNGTRVPLRHRFMLSGANLRPEIETEEPPLMRRRITQLDDPAARVRAARLARGWTLEKLGQEASMRPADVAAIEGRHKGIGPVRAKRLGAALGVDPRELVEERYRL